MQIEIIVNMKNLNDNNNKNRQQQQKINNINNKLLLIKPEENLQLLGIKIKKDGFKFLIKWSRKEKMKCNTWSRLRNAIAMDRLKDEQTHRWHMAIKLSEEMNKIKEDVRGFVLRLLRILFDFLGFVEVSEFSTTSLGFN